MKPYIIVVWASLAGALVGAGCNGGGGTALPTFNPFGTDPAPKTGYEPPGSSGLDQPPSSQPPPATGSVEQLCAYDCQRIETLCPGGSGGASCATSCAMALSYFPNCETQFKAYLSCVATASITCSNGSVQISGCDPQVAAVNSCSSGTTAAAPQ